MFVCICNSIREKELRAAARDSVCRPNEVYEKLGRRPKCGQCVAFARTIIESERASVATA